MTDSLEHQEQNHETISRNRNIEIAGELDEIESIENVWIGIFYFQRVNLGQHKLIFMYPWRSKW